MSQLSSAIILMLSLLACGQDESISEINNISDQDENKNLDVRRYQKSNGEKDNTKNEDLPRRDELNDESALPPMATTGTFLTSCYLHEQKILCALDEEGITVDDEVTYKLEIKLFAGDKHISASKYNVKILTHDDWLFKIELKDTLVNYSGSLVIEMTLVEVYPDGYENIIAELIVKQSE